MKKIKNKGKIRASARTKHERLEKYLLKRRRARTKCCCQRDGFLNRYDCAYAGRDTVNQAIKGLDSLAPKLIGQSLKEIDKIAETRTRQIMNDGRQQIQKIVPKIIRGAIEDVYKTPFRLRGHLGKKKFA